MSNPRSRQSVTSSRGSPSVNLPVLPHIENETNGSLFSWARSLTDSNLTWFQQIVDSFGRVGRLIDTLFAERMRWVFPYIVGESYEKNDVVVDEGWLMVANVDTFERASPQPVGEATYLYSGTSPTAIKNGRQVVFGTEYTSLIGAFVSGYRVWTVAGNEYRVVVLTPEGQHSTLLTFTATASGWQDLALTPVPIPANLTFSMYVVAKTPDPTPTVTLANYDYSKPQNDTAPVSGQITHSVKSLGVINVHKSDNDGIVRTALLSSLNVGDTIAIGGQVWAVQASTNQGAYYSFDISPAQHYPSSGVVQVSFSVTAAQPVTIIEDTNYWTPTTNVRGFLGVDTDFSGITYNQNGYGIDLLAQEANVSEDWDVMAYTSTYGTQEFTG